MSDSTKGREGALRRLTVTDHCVRTMKAKEVPLGGAAEHHHARRLFYFLDRRSLRLFPAAKGLRASMSGRWVLEGCKVGI